MASALKDIYSHEFFEFFCEQFSKFYYIDSAQFYANIFDSNWEHRALKDRMKHTAYVLHSLLPIPYPQQIQLLCDFVASQKDMQKSDWLLAYMFIPQFIEDYGLDCYAESVAAIEKVTQFTSCEFAIRPFIKKYPDEAMSQMLEWSTHKQHTVRRLSSEGCRPRLPWGMQLHDFVKNPTAILPILENLKSDESLFVRKSVANNLNDISKDNPHIILELCNRWGNSIEYTKWIVKHGLRTLLKKGNVEALGLVGIAHNEGVEVSNFKIISNNITQSQPLLFSFSIQNNLEIDVQVRVEYALYFLRSRNVFSKKIFQIHNRFYKANECIVVQKTHSFKPISTRKYYTGQHFISVIVNGVESEKIEFVLQ